LFIGGFIRRTSIGQWLDDVVKNLFVSFQCKNLFVLITTCSNKCSYYEKKTL
jgi:hypothetical protein